MILHLDTLLLLLHLRLPLFLGLNLSQEEKVKERKLCLWRVTELERKKVRIYVSSRAFFLRSPSIHHPSDANHIL